MKIIYSTATQSFTKKCLTLYKEILINEVGLKLRGKTFIFKGFIYPFHIVTFEGGNKLGYFNSFLMEIGIGKQLMFAQDDLLVEVIKHEIAHLLAFLEYGNLARPHGREFKDICIRYGWKTSIKATIPMEEVEKKSKKLMSKVVKLFDLSNSSNAHEAKSALNKARSLMIEHGIDTVVNKEEEDFIVVRVLETKRSNEKLKAIAQILRSFFVYPVINHGRGKVYLEIFGERRHVEIGEYIAKLLDIKLDQLWKSETVLSGLRAKNSFLRGIAEGFTSDAVSNKERGVIKIEKALKESISIAYPHLSHVRSGARIDKKALKEGLKVGSKLKLPKGVNKSKSPPLLSLKS